MAAIVTPSIPLHRFELSKFAMETEPNLFVGKSFSSYNELYQFISEYEYCHRQKFWKRSSRKITSTANIKRHINPDLVYYEISYSCIHGGEKFKSRSKGMRKSITFRLGAPCTAYIRLRASPDGQTLDVKGFSDHHNHISIQSRWTVGQVEALIEEYKKYPALYQSTHQDYKNTDLKNDCIAKIVQTLQPIRLGVTEVDVLSQWNNLMIKFAHAQHFQKNLKRENIDEPQFWYLQKLDFLKVHISSELSFEEEDNPDFFEPEIRTETHEWENGSDPLASSSSPRIKEEIDESGKKSNEENSSKDENDIFGEFVATQLKKITNDGVRQDVVFEIHQVLHKALKKK